MMSYGINQIGIPKGQSGWISKLNPLNWFKKEEPKEKYLGSWSLQPITEDNTYYDQILNSLLQQGVPLEEAKRSAAMSDRMAKETKVFSSSEESTQSLNRNGRHLGTIIKGDIMNLNTTEQGDSIWSYVSSLNYPHLNNGTTIAIDAIKNADSDDYHYKYDIWENGKRKTEYGDGQVPSHIRPYLDKVNAAASKGIKRGTNGL